MLVVIGCIALHVDSFSLLIAWTIDEVRYGVLRTYIVVLYVRGDVLNSCMAFSCPKRHNTLHSGEVLLE